MTRYGFPLTVLLLGVLTVLSSGCGRGELAFFPVEGTITKGGHPLSNIEVVFLADPDAGTVGPRASGRTDEFGHYRLRTDQGNDGAVAGGHLVLILDNEIAEKQADFLFRRQLPEERRRPSMDNAKRLQEELKSASAVSRVPPKYGHINETSLRVEVRPGPQVIDFDVKDTDVQIRLIGAPVK
jgi:hypothetical protein